MGTAPCRPLLGGEKNGHLPSLGKALVLLPSMDAGPGVVVDAAAVVGDKSHPACP